MYSLYKNIHCVGQWLSAPFCLNIFYLYHATCVLHATKSTFLLIFDVTLKLKTLQQQILSYNTFIHIYTCSYKVPSYGNQLPGVMRKILTQSVISKYICMDNISSQATGHAVSTIGCLAVGQQGVAAGVSGAC